MPVPDEYLVHNVERGLRRLLLAPWDLAPRVAPGPPRASVQGAEPVHQRLLLTYLDEIEAAVAEAADWWIGLVDRRAEREGDFRKGLLGAFSERPAGPAAHGRVVSVLRRNWLEVAATNQSLEESRRVPPHDLLLRWPAELGKREVVAILSGMPYWPIGLDADGDWC